LLSPIVQETIRYDSSNIGDAVEVRAFRDFAANEEVIIYSNGLPINKGQVFVVFKV
jgi:hypothetical protein